MTEFRNPVRLVLKFEDWPDADQKQWAALTASGTLFDDGPLSQWSDGSARIRRQGYGQWLSYLARHHPKTLGQAPADRITVETVRGWVEECGTRLKDRSTYNLITSVLVLAMALAPDRDWQWMQRLQARLRLRLDTTALAARPPISAFDIFEWSLRRLKEVESLDHVTDLKRAIQFREALMIGFLIARPVRRRALLAMEIGKHILAIEDGYRLSFGTGDTKDKRDRSYTLPLQLCGPMTTYLDRYRPILLRLGTSSALWLSQYGKPLTPDGFSKALPKTTEQQLGVALRPHAFRHIAATSIAERDPEHVGIIRDILGHATLRMAEKHYNRAQQMDSARRYGVVLEELKKKLS